MRTIMAISAFFFIGPSGSYVNAESLATTTIAERAIPATVTILTLGVAGDTLGQGSGFIKSSTGIIITNWHVLRGAYSAIIMTATGEQFGRVTYLDGDSTFDIAILKIPGFGLDTIPVVDETPPVGSRIVAIGSPLGLEHTVSEGIVSAIRVFNGRTVIQLSAPINPGSSGGPVIDLEGNVFGLAMATIRGEQQLGFATPIKYALGLLQGVKHEKELYNVFGNVPSGRTSPQMPRNKEIPPEPTLNPERDVAGVYACTGDIESIDSTHSWADNQDFAGILVIGDNDLGWFVLSVNINDVNIRLVLPVMAFTCTMDGQVMLDVAGVLVLNGYQIQGGFYLVSSTFPGGSTARMVARLSPSPLSEPIGLYNISARTIMTVNGNTINSPIDWAGQAVAVCSKDSIYITCQMKNQFGGGIEQTFSGPINDMKFDLTDDRKKAHLKGRFTAGRLWANWIDDRDDGVIFEGPINGQRR